MITKAKNEQTDEIKELRRICFPDEDPRYTDFFFRYIYKPENCYLYMSGGEILSCIIRDVHPLMFNGRVIQASMLTGAATRPDVRKNGYMHKLLQVVMDACEHSELLTFVQSEEPDLFEHMGFRRIYKRNVYEISRMDCRRTTNFGINFDPSAIDLLKVYSAYISRFNGFYTRDLPDFVTRIKEARETGRKIIAYFNGKDQIQGYAIMKINDDCVDIEELTYLSGMALLKLCNTALQEKDKVYLHVSDAEDMNKVFPRASAKEELSAMARLNDAALFSKLYNTKVTDTRDLRAVSLRPLNLNEKY